MTQRPSPNFTPSDGTPKVGFIIHGTLGRYEGAIEWLCTPPEKRAPVSYSSAHYVIAKDGRYTQLVQNKDVAWHAGTISNPVAEAKTVLPKTVLGTYKNPNQSFIGIECEWFMGDALTDTQFAVIAKIILESGISNPIVLTHSMVTDFKADFWLSSAGIVAEIKKRLVPALPSKEELRAQIIKLLNQL